MMVFFYFVLNFPLTFISIIQQQERGKCTVSDTEDDEVFDEESDTAKDPVPKDPTPPKSSKSSKSSGIKVPPPKRIKKCTDSIDDFVSGAFDHHKPSHTTKVPNDTPAKRKTPVANESESKKSSAKAKETAMFTPTHFRLALYHRKITDELQSK